MKDEYKDYIALKPYQFLSTRVIYEGLWKDQKKNGIGKQYWEDGSIYHGEWKDN